MDSRLRGNDERLGNVKRKLGILISGRGSNMMALAEAARDPACPYEVALVASDKPAAPGLVWAAEQGIATFALSPKGMPKADYEAAIDRALRDAGVEAIALAGYMRLLTDAFVARWCGRIVNIPQRSLRPWQCVRSRRATACVPQAYRRGR